MVFRRLVPVIVAGFLGSLPALVLAHHSRTFFSEDFVELEGQLNLDPGE